MLKSIKSFIQSPYNKNNLLDGVKRVLVWKIVKLFKLKDFEYTIWRNRKVLLRYNSFQCMWLMYNSWVDWEEFNLIKDYVKQNDNVADVGTNLGYYTLWFSRFVNNKGSIHSFEPNIKNYKWLIKNIQLNNISQVYPNQIALSNKTGTLYFTDSLDEKNHITEDIKGNKIHAISFDDYSQRNKIDNYSYVKVDIEGYEYFFLKGAENLLTNKSIEIIQLEINNALEYSGVSINDLLELLKIYGYILCMYDVQHKVMRKVNYSLNRENYFAVADIDKVNAMLIYNLHTK